MKKKTVLHLVFHLRNIYGTRNQRSLPTAIGRTNFLFSALTALEAAERKGTAPNYSVLLASIFARLVCIIDIEGDAGVRKFVQAVAEKYRGSCAYCHAIPCNCPVRGPRIDPESGDASSADINAWNLGDLQQRLEKIYGERNRLSGTREAILRLFAEVAEISAHTLSAFATETKTPPDGYYEEAADALAWLLAVANLLEVNLPHAVHERYDNGCPACRNLPCTCLLHEYAETRSLPRTTSA